MIHVYTTQTLPIINIKKSGCKIEHFAREKGKMLENLRIKHFDSFFVSFHAYENLSQAKCFILYTRKESLARGGICMKWSF